MPPEPCGTPAPVRVNSPAPPLEWWRVAAPTVWLPTAQEMADLDRAAVSSGAIPERALIENAGRALALRVQTRWPEGRVLCLAGSGHNGADALVAARTLAAWGRPVELVSCGSRPPVPDVLAGWDLRLESPAALDSALSRADVALDGILGTGVDSAPREPQAGMIERLNAGGLRVVAVDGPSGIDFTTGAVPGAAVRADLTVTFGWPKLGLLRFPARDRCGDIEAVEIGFPPPAPPPAARLITAAWVHALLGTRPDDAHKASAGYLALVGGQPGMAGAVVLAARAAIRAGAGIVKVVSAPANREIVQTAVPSAVFVDWEDGEAVSATVSWARAVAIGPGLGTSAGARERVERVLSEAGERVVVLDADALNVWEDDPEALAAALPQRALLTPHPGEMGRLWEGGREAVLDDPPRVALAVAARLGCAVLLKGAPTWVATPDGALRVTSVATPAFATGGVGDVLTGLAGAYAAAGLEPADAATCALGISGLAALAAPGPVGHAAQDLPDRIPGARGSLDGLRPGAWPGVLVALPAAHAGPSDD